MIEDLEADFTGEPKEASNTDDVALAEVANADEVITAEAKASNEMKKIPKNEWNTESYKEIINIYIENIKTIEKRHKVYTKQ